MTDHIDNRIEFDAQTAAARAVMEWIDKPLPPEEPRRALIGCTPAMIAQLAADAYRDHIAEHGSTFTFDEMRITLVAFAMWLQIGDPRTPVSDLVDRFIEETTEDETDL
jgi:hypothetical protein